jgi:hypothetical protein
VFTLIVSLVVVAASVAAVVRLALAEQGQPATDRSATRRARPARQLRRGRAGPAGEQTRAQPHARPVPVVAVADLDRVGALRRIRSGFALLLLLAFVGTLLAAAVGTLLFIAGLALRNAVS